MRYVPEAVQGPQRAGNYVDISLWEKKALPDLILVDIGKGQFDAASGALEDLGVGHLPVVSLAKKEETIFAPDRKKTYDWREHRLP